MVLKSKTADLSWQTIDFSPDVPETLLVPEHHWPGLTRGSLSEPQRIRLNHFATYFMCEMFIHFERSIIEYMNLHRVRILDFLNEKQFQRFVDEEVDHVRAFETLAKKIRPDLYLGEPRFLKPARMDGWVVKHSPIPTFFLMAALFEEMTLFVYEVMQEDPSQSWAPAFDVMKLHAIEEKGHVGMDRLVLKRYAQERPWRLRLETTALLPLVAYSDRRVAQAWKAAARHFGAEENLTAAQRKSIENKGLSRSDLLGMRSFVQKNKQRPVPGNGLLCFALDLLTK